MYKQRLVAAIMTTAFYGLCRIGELVMAMNEKTVVKRDDMVMGNGHFMFKVWNAKTASLGQVQQIEIVETGAVHALSRCSKGIWTLAPGKLTTFLF